MIRSTKNLRSSSLERISRPGLRQYASPAEFKRVKNGLGVAIVSTSKGVMTDKEAKAAECRWRSSVLRLLITVSELNKV